MSADGENMRKLWECAKVGNYAMDLLREAARMPDDAKVDKQYIHALFRMPGFLTDDEMQATKAIQEQTIQIWRGCPEDEHETGMYGLSWTTSERIARWFASRSDKRSSVLQAETQGADCYVLHTCESEIVVLGDPVIKNVTPCTWESFKIEWGAIPAK